MTRGSAPATGVRGSASGDAAVGTVRAFEAGVLDEAEARATAVREEHDGVRVDLDRVTAESRRIEGEVDLLRQRKNAEHAHATAHVDRYARLLRNRRLQPAFLAGAAAFAEHVPGILVLGGTGIRIDGGIVGAVLEPADVGVNFLRFLFRGVALRDDARNRPLYGAPGFAYVYLNYGIHCLFNVVTEPAGAPAAVVARLTNTVVPVCMSRR